MKRITVIFLLILLLFTFVSCTAEDQTESPQNSNPAPISDEKTVLSTEPEDETNPSGDTDEDPSEGWTPLY